MEEQRKRTALQEIRMTAGENRRMVNEKHGKSRFQAGLSEKKPGVSRQSLFGLRVIISLLLFAGFCFMERESGRLGTCSSDTICQMIQNDLDLSRAGAESVLGKRVLELLTDPVL